VGVVTEHVRAHRRSLAVSYGAVVVENTFELLYPFAIGLAVDGLLDDSWTGVIVFVVISLTHTAVGVARQWYDTRSFNRLWAEMATDLVAEQRADGVSTTAVVARATLVGEYVEFLERDVPLAIGAAFAVFGSLVMIFLYDPMIGIAAALVAIPVVLLNRRLVRRSGRVYRTLNDQSELEVTVIETASVEDVRRHYRLLGRHWNRLSDNEAVSWGIVDVIAVGLAVYALVRATDSSFEVGAIFAIIAYVWAYLAGFDEVPGVLQRMSNLADIRRRIDVIESGGSSAPEEPDESLSSSP
jgi:ABC-type multidrug transport system fused ATPase/permease subunit